MKNKVIVVIGAILVILTAAFFYNKYRIAPKINLDSLLLTDLNGNRVSLEGFKNKKLFIHFFATWCGPCLQELPSIIKAQSILEKENFQVIIVSDEPISILLPFRERTGIPLVILRSEKNLSEFRIVTLPTSYVLNSKNEIAFTKVGAIDWANNNMIEKLKSISN